ncbi:hypothetical protein GQN54_11300, partial [Cryomorphaceae bacterium S-15]|nr:hypothetical protein [Acidiluteibacter ferrifornacis]
MNFLILFSFLFSFNSNAQGYSEVTAPQCISTTSSTLNFSFPSPRPPANDGQLTIYFKGDLDGGTGGGEVMEIYDPSNNLVATTPAASGQCLATYDSATFTIPLATLIGWVGGPTLDIDVLALPNVSTTLCATGSCAYLKLEYPSVSGDNDAAVLAIDSPSVFCAGSQPVYATIANGGSNQINSLTINWEVNGVAQTAVSYTQLIDTINGSNPNSVSVLLGSANFTAGNNTIKVYSSMPNGVADTVNFNDTAFVNVMTASQPTSVLLINTTLNSATIDAIGGAGAVEYEFGPVGFAQSSGTLGSSPTSLFTINGLTSGTTYDVYVRSNCGSGDVSSWVGPLTFGTSYGVPYFEDFELFTAGNVVNPWPRGWSSTNNASAPRWESEDATGANENSLNTGPFYDNTTPSTVGG